MIEVLVSIALVSITGLGLTNSLVTAHTVTKHTELNHICSALAVSRMEQLAALNVASLTAAYSGTDSTITWAGSNLTFTRVTTVVVNADGSRTVTVNVSPNNSVIDTSVNFSNDFAKWE